MQYVTEDYSQRRNIIIIAITYICHSMSSFSDLVENVTEHRSKRLSKNYANK